MADAAFTTIKNVPITSVGMEWPLSTGTRAFTLDDLYSVVNAPEKDSAVKLPRLRLGHDGPDWGDAEPAFGRVENMYVNEEDLTLYGDLCNIPTWLAGVLPVVYPNRSLDGYANFKTATGKTHALVMTELALLGVMLPGISTLKDLPDLFTVEIPTGTVIDMAPADSWLAAGGAMPAAVAGAVEIDQIRRDFYGNFATGDYEYWWCRTITVEPNQVIAEGDDGELWRVPFSVNASNDEITWGEASRVRVVYEDVAAATQQARATLVFASAEESRPKEQPVADEEKPGTTTPPGTTVEDPPGTTPPADPPPDDDDDDGDDTPPATPPHPEPTTAAAAGVVTLDKEQYEKLKAGAEAGLSLQAAADKGRQEGKVDAAIKAAKIPNSRRAHYNALMKADEEGTTKLLETLEAGVLPIDEIGSDAPDNNGAGASVAATQYNESMLTPAERAAKAAANGGEA